MTIHQKGTNSKKEGWIYINYLYMQTVSSDLINTNGRKRVGVTFLADATKFNHPTRFTVLHLRNTPNATLDGNDYIPDEDGTTYFSQDITRYPDTKNLMSGTMYFDVPDGLEEFYIVLQNVNVDFYIEEIWLE